MVVINNQGRTSYFLNNVRVSVPNVCVTGSSIRCHGIDGVLPASFVSPSTHCSNGSRGNPVEPKVQGLPSPPSPRDPNLNAMPPLSPSNHHTVSGSPPFSGRGEFRYMWALALALAALWSAGGIVNTQ
ncbi:hypothetical protein MLD38_033620 [Melastoma candidum]|nr:hypothetical protein MLD38_033620 [Melastoma candidum]